MWNAPAFLPACSQAVLTGPVPALCRNYDYSPELWEQTIYTSEFTGRRVIGTGDCLWGLLDGMNDAGLAVSLTFGGRPGSGDGFAIPLVIRYLLEVAETADQAKQLLRGLPIAMSYNLAVVDAAGHAFTAFVAPGQEPEFSDAVASTNHHGAVPEFPQRAAVAAQRAPAGPARRGGCQRPNAERSRRRLPGRAAVQHRISRGRSAPCTRRCTCRPKASSNTAGRMSPGGAASTIPAIPGRSCSNEDLTGVGRRWRADRLTATGRT